MKPIALTAQWAGDYDVARQEYGRLFTEALERGDPIEARLLLAAEVRCQVAFSMEGVEGPPLETLRNVVKKMIREKEAQIKEHFASGSEADVERLIQDASQISKEVTKAIKAFMPYPHEEENRGEHDRAVHAPPYSFGERRIVVLGTPRGIEARSYYQGDITLDLGATGEQLKEGGGGNVIMQTDRMLEVQFGPWRESEVHFGTWVEVVEIFVDGRIQCISEHKDQTRDGIAKLIEHVARRLVIRRATDLS